MKENGEGMPFLKVVLTVLLLLLCTAITYYFHFVLGIGVIYTHLFYVPIVLAGVWWEKKAFFVSAFLALLISASHLISGVEYPLTEDVLRGVMFLVVGYVLGIAEERNRLQIEALKEKDTKIGQMETRNRYVQTVSNELRNPLQVLMGALEMVEFREHTTEQKKLVDMLNEATNEIGQKIKELT